MQDESIMHGCGASRLNRRTLLKGSAAAGAAVALGPIAKRSAFAAPAFLQGTNIVFALTNEDAAKVQPLLDDYSKQNNVS
ncbi:MAG TPA: twin-arginine translocation signal domain-containing protein, partial [Thermomicrobiales bacterium]|nr:twin-arginine translocation signal domain-containing protein [Thermomicrobiales bacterium]